MTVPGVNVITASTFMAAVGDIRRFPSARKLVGYLGLDPKVRQSGPTPARHGRISKQGSAAVRHVLVEAAGSRSAQPGPLRAFYERVRARRGAQVAIVATARKLACLFWCLLTREQDYAFGQPSLTAKKIRRARARRRRAPRKGQAAPAPAPAPPRSATPNATSPAKPSTPTAARSATGRPPRPRRRARARHRGAHLKGPRRAKPRGRPQAPDVCASLRQSLAPTRTIPQEPPATKPLTFIRQAAPTSLVRVAVPAVPETPARPHLPSPSHRALCGSKRPIGLFRPFQSVPIGSPRSSRCWRSRTSRRDQPDRPDHAACRRRAPHAW